MKPQEKFRADVGNAIADAHKAGMTSAAIATLLHQALHTVNTVAGWDKPTLTTARSGSSRTAQCL